MKKYTYENTVKELNKKGSIYGIETMQRLLGLLGHPENDLKIIHTAGTNGKGSTLAFLGNILEKSGYRVGRYISPTVICYEERFQINGKYIKKNLLEKYFIRISEASKQMEERNWAKPTAFEVETAIALLYFKEKKVDYALIEVGMGGLTDATNAIEKPVLCIITSISEDHKKMLGNTVEEIAVQKAGIIKKDVPVILAVNPPNVQKVLTDRCKEVGSCPWIIQNSDYEIVKESPVHSEFLWKNQKFEIRLPGKHQVDNAMNALVAAFLLILAGAKLITVETMKKGLKETRWPGRLELLQTNPAFYLDGAHNPDGARKLGDFLEKHFTNKKIIYIMGVLGDKEYDKMLQILLPYTAAVYVFTPNNARGLKAEDLADAISSYSIPVTICESVTCAVEQAFHEEKDADCFVLCGSLSFIEEFRQHAKKDNYK